MRNIDPNGLPAPRRSGLADRSPSDLSLTNRFLSDLVLSLFSQSAQVEVLTQQIRMHKTQESKYSSFPTRGINKA